MIATPETIAWEDDVAWVQPVFSRADVNRAGDALLSETDPVALAKAREVLGNWRAAHGLPLNGIAMTMKGRVKRLGVDSILAQRLKRLVSIENKLVRRKNQRATQIQDIGGARVILPTMADVLALRAMCSSGDSRVFKEHKVDDYIAAPKASGYRSLHVVYRYESPEKKPWQNMRIELQIRTKLQHAWAAAVEAVGFFSGWDLKASEGNPEWLRLFVLMGHWMAQEEGYPGVESLAGTGSAYLDEITKLWIRLNGEAVLTGWEYSVSEIRQMHEKQGSWRFLLHLDARAPMITITGYHKKDEGGATEDYAALEANTATDPYQHVVLVTVKDINELESAYPGFFAETAAFRQSVGRAIEAARPATIRLGHGVAPGVIDRASGPSAP